jgi:hypothetical protein
LRVLSAQQFGLFLGELLGAFVTGQLHGRMGGEEAFREDVAREADAIRDARRADPLEVAEDRGYVLAALQDHDARHRRHRVHGDAHLEHHPGPVGVVVGVDRDQDGRPGDLLADLLGDAARDFDALQPVARQEDVDAVGRCEREPLRDGLGDGVVVVAMADEDERRP